MNSSKPAAPGFSFQGFAERGGRTGEHRDGWGIAFHDGPDCRVIGDHLASIESPLALAVKRDPIKSKNIVAHIRKATQGRVAAENSHPFVRSLWGRAWSFAHNGDLKTFAPDSHAFAATGDTDSEGAFCHLLSGLLRRFPDGRPPRAALFAALQELAAQIAGHGAFNFLLSDGEVMYAHCSTSLFYLVREYPFAVASLVDCDLSIDFSRHNHLDDRISVIATQPLTSNEAWTAFTPGELKMFVDGKPVDVEREEIVRTRPALSFAI